MRKILRLIGKIILIIISFVLIYLLAAFFLSKIIIEKELGTSNDVTIYILTNGVHTDIVVPVKNKQMDWSKKIKYTDMVEVDSTYNYLGLGWGDRAFYLNTPTWSDLKVSIAFKAVFGLGDAAIHATYHKNLTESNTCIKLEISNEQYYRLINFIKNSFETDSQGCFINIKTDTNYGKTDAFYEAVGSFSMFYTCNTWANNALKAAGQKSVFWTPFNTGIFAIHK